MGKKKTKVVFDANIYLSFFLTSGETIAAIFNFWLKGKFNVYASPEIIAEVQKASGYPKLQKRITYEDRVKIRLLFQHFVKQVYPTRTISFSKDPDDAKYLEASRECEADYLVTGNKHLLSLKKFGQTKIVSPSEFRQILKIKK